MTRGMRFKQVWINFSFLKELRVVWERITISRLTIGYIIFSIVHCILQTGFQSGAFVLNSHAEDFLEGILDQAGAARFDVIPVLKQDIRLCTSQEPDSCVVAWDGSPQTNFLSEYPPDDFQGDPTSSLPTVTPTSASISATLEPSSTSRVPTAAPTPSTTNDSDDDDEEALGSDIASQAPDDLFEIPSSAPFPPLFDNDDRGTGDGTTTQERSPFSPRSAPFSNGYYTISIPEGEVQLTKACVDSLNYPAFSLERTKREDAAFILFNLWVLGMSVVAVLNESIPHIAASLLTHVLATGWGGSQLYHTRHFQLDFEYAITDGACAGAPPFLADYWGSRSRAEIPGLVLNALALLISVVLSYFLAKTFGWKTFKRIGASLTIYRLYVLVLIFSIAVQMSLFFIAVTVGLWVDQLYEGPPGHFADHLSPYRAIGFITILLSVPWLFAGWTGARQEKRLRMAVFLGLSGLYIVAWTLQFISGAFRWAVWSWPFFQIMVIISLVLTVLTFLVGLLVRLNFGKGLVHYLHHDSELPEPHFEPYTGPTQDRERGFGDEKIAFPGLQSDIQQYPDLPSLNLPPPVTNSKQEIRRKPVPSLPQSLKNVPRYQNLFRPGSFKQAVTSKFSFSAKSDSDSSSISTMSAKRISDASTMSYPMPLYMSNSSSAS